MKFPVLRTINGFVTGLLLLISLITVASLILLCGLLIRVLPLRSWRKMGTYFLLKIPDLWNQLNYWILLPNFSRTLEIKGNQTLSKKEWYLMISNHQSWADILLLTTMFRKKVPILKFFMKKELLWSLPIAGLACYFLGYPFMHRHTASEIRKNPKLKGQDIETAKKACKKFREFPTTAINFAEGTRFTEQKREKQESPYRYLLKPKSGGIATVLNEMHDKLSGIINITIHYQDQTRSFWQFLCGNTGKIIIEFELIPISKELLGNYYEDRSYRARFQQWLNQIWQDKDARLEDLQKQ